jgi:hypothetical protein
MLHWEYMGPVFLSSLEKLGGTLLHTKALNASNKAEKF